MNRSDSSPSPRTRTQTPDYRTVDRILLARALEHPTKSALVDARTDRRISFSRLNLLASAGARLLHRLHLAPGDRILVLVPMSVELYVVLAGIFRAGAVALFVDPGAPGDLLTHAINSLQPKAFVGSPAARLLQFIRPALTRIPIHLGTGIKTPGAIPWPTKPCSHAFDPPALDPAAPALITFTSGSTGSPRAAVRSHEFLLAQLHSLETTLHLRPEQTDLATLPIFTLANLGVGLTTVLPDVDLARPAIADPLRLLQAASRYRADRITASPALLENLADTIIASDPARASSRSCATGGIPPMRDSSEPIPSSPPISNLHSPLCNLQSFRRIFTGGAPVSRKLLRKLQTAFPQAKVAAVYGSTEAEPIALLDPADEPEPQTARVAVHRALVGLPVGRPVPEIDVRILPDRWGEPIGPLDRNSFDALCLPPNHAGEIVVAGPHVLSGYLDPAHDGDTKIHVAREVYHRVGDAGRLDADGRLHLLGRCAARLPSPPGDPSVPLYPFALEAPAMEHPDIRRAAFLSVNNKLILAIELVDGARHKKNELISELTCGFAWANLNRVVVLDRLPVDSRHNAKIDYPALRRLFD